MTPTQERINQVAGYITLFISVNTNSVIINTILNTNLSAEIESWFEHSPLTGWTKEDIASVYKQVLFNLVQSQLDKSSTKTCEKMQSIAAEFLLSLSSPLRQKEKERTLQDAYMLLGYALGTKSILIQSDERLSLVGLQLPEHTLLSYWVYMMGGDLKDDSNDDDTAPIVKRVRELFSANLSIEDILPIIIREFDSVNAEVLLKSVTSAFEVIASPPSPSPALEKEDHKTPPFQLLDIDDLWA